MPAIEPHIATLLHRRATRNLDELRRREEKALPLETQAGPPGGDSATSPPDPTPDRAPEGAAP